MSEVIITRLGHLGDGIADGPLYAPRTLPGEAVTGVPQGDQLTAIRIVTPSPHRVRPPCPHYRRCGGCGMQHAEAAFLRAWKERTVREALTGQGLTAPVSMAHVSPPGSRRRATFSARRMRQGALAGFHMRASDEIAAIPDCRLLVPELMAALPFVEALAIAGGSRKAELRVFVTASLSGLDAAVTGGKPVGPDLLQALAALTRAHDVARLVWDGETVVQNVVPAQDFDGIRIAPPPGAFLQPTADGEAALRRAVAMHVRDTGPVADLFSGCGTFALPLARTAPVHAVEGDAAMLAALDAGYRRATGLKPVTHEVRDLFRDPLRAEELRRFHTVVLDPPRAGAQAQCVHLAQAGVPGIVYVSCNPVTFARDARILCESGYDLGAVQVFDQFRWSAHTELVGYFSGSG